MKEKWKTLLQAMIFPTIALVVICYGYYRYLNKPSSGLASAMSDVEMFPVWLFVVLSLVGYFGITAVLYLLLKESGVSGAR